MRTETGILKSDDQLWHAAVESIRLPSAEMAAAYEEWADFYEFQLEQRAGELSADDRKRNMVERWTADMAYQCRRCASWARGVNPGEPIPLSVRRPDLEAASRVILAEILAEIDKGRQQGEAPARHLCMAG